MTPNADNCCALLGNVLAGQRLTPRVGHVVRHFQQSAGDFLTGQQVSGPSPREAADSSGRAPEPGPAVSRKRSGKLRDPRHVTSPRSARQDHFASRWPARRHVAPGAAALIGTAPRPSRRREWLAPATAADAADSGAGAVRPHGQQSVLFRVVLQVEIFAQPAYGLAWRDPGMHRIRPAPRRRWRARQGTR